MASPVFWVIPVAVLGGIVGSFLNVVIFRLPLGLSITQPRWSFCPHCSSRIRPHHNVPILSWLWLRGRCRCCRAPIASMYPVIECTSVLMFVMVWDALFLTNVVPGIRGPADDWPMAVAYISLFAGLLAMSGMDIESYIIDIRISAFMIIAGIACHAVWGVPGTVLNPVATKTTGVLPPALCLIGAAMGLTWLVTFLIGSHLRSRHNPPSAHVGAKDDTDGGGGARIASAYTNTADQRFQPVPIIALCGVTLALIAWQIFATGYGLTPRIPPGGQRGFVACFLFMVLLILASMVTRESDRQVIQEIEADRAKARPNALGEFAWFIPALAVGICLLVLLRHSGNIDASWQDAIDAIRNPRDAVSGLGALAPHAAGGLRAVGAMVFAATLGWTVRILGTLGFGKEALGTGDIYIMAAIGAVAGFWAVVFAFFLAAILALVGVLATLFRKRSRAIPLGPWLAMGAFVTLWLQGLFLELFGRAGTLFWSVISGRPSWSAGG